MLSITQLRILDQLPDIQDGDDRGDYIKRCVRTLADENMMAVMQVAQHKWDLGLFAADQEKARELVKLLRDNHDQSVTNDALALLLKKVFEL